MEEKFIQINIAIRIPENVAGEAIALSREISQKEDAYFVLDGVEYFPHITIYQPEFPEKSLEKILKTVGEVAENFSPISLNYTKILSHKGWIGIHFENSRELANIHEILVKKLNPLREGHLKDKYKNSEHCQLISQEQRENILSYGYSALMSLYDPHLTIIRLKDEILAEQVAKDVEWKIEKFSIDKIGVFVSGEHGTCRKLIKEFNLD